MILLAEAKLLLVMSLTVARANTCTLHDKLNHVGGSWYKSAIPCLLQEFIVNKLSNNSWAPPLGLLSIGSCICDKSLVGMV